MYEEANGPNVAKSIESIGKLTNVAIESFWLTLNIFDSNTTHITLKTQDTLTCDFNGH